MVFKRMLGAFGVGAPSVDTVLTTSRTRPGGTLEGEVRLKGGDFDAEIEHVTLGLVARVEVEYGDSEGAGVNEFARLDVSGPFTLRKGEDRTLGFTMPVPWEAPVSEIGGQPLRGMVLGVRTELAIAKAVDKGDLDLFAVEPMPSQLRILEAFLALGFSFKSADLEMGRLVGVDQRLPFYQEIEFYPPPQHQGLVNEVEVTFVASPDGLTVVLEADKRAGRYSSGDAIDHFTVSHDDALRTDWTGEIGRWLQRLAEYGGHHGAPHGYHDPHHDPHHHGHHDPHHHGHHHGGGPGVGAVVAAGAAGVVGGLVAGEIVEEIFEGDDDGGGDDEW
ncbi:Sporulation-control protein spo0M [Nonomuraea coxensis DSM 45129]|uniref:Sporulation-control protein spo0M n=1 Tax=Nonomuraea coxensis DSM 45129 TaxID=1122611 RepID=A0ABX8U905_9ACTN|nr:sporulation protein [Nonomuraea coxensis]QYC43229.1 Sporulation-control protein spo0M [Nonomuraea coxensis DSM 45129]